MRKVTTDDNDVVNNSIAQENTSLSNNTKIIPSGTVSNSSDHLKLRQGRERHIGLNIGQYTQSVPMLFTRDGHNVWLGDIYRGCCAFLILGGPSFKNINKDLLKSPGILTLGVNNSVKSFRPNIWTSVDDPTHFIKSIWLDPKIMKLVPFCHTDKFIFDNEKWEITDIKTSDCPNVLYYRRNEKFQPDQFLDENTFNWGCHKEYGGGRSVMLVAIRMLYYLGCRKVFLLGCDFNMNDKNKYHFEQDRTPQSISGNNSTYALLKERFEQLKPLFDSRKFEIYNCNPDSGLKVFPYMSFDDAVKIATQHLPSDIENERTDGLYDRVASISKSKEITKPDTKLPQPNRTYTEQDKIAIKEKLDKQRRYLNDCKDKLKMLQTAVIIDHAAIKATELQIIDARKKFKSTEKLKNMIWGIVK